MTASGSCSVCGSSATNYVSQLKEWRCEDHHVRYLSPEEKLEEVNRYLKSIEPKRKPKKGNSPFGKKYF